MMARRDGYPENIYDFPGIYEPGTEADQRMQAIAADMEADDAGIAKMISFSSPMSDHGITSADFVARFCARPRLGDNNRLNTLLDQQWLVSLDKRARFCRLILDEAELAADEATVSRIMTSIGEQDGPAWFAAKFLAHVDAAFVELDRQPIDPFALAREFCLLGETWAEARFIVNHGRWAAGKAASLAALPGARQAAANGRKIGADWHSEVCEEAQRIWAINPTLRKNVSETARRVRNRLDPQPSLRQVRRVISGIGRH